MGDIWWRGGGRRLPRPGPTLVPTTVLGRKFNLLRPREEICDHSQIIYPVIKSPILHQLPSPKSSQAALRSKLARLKTKGHLLTGPNRPRRPPFTS